MPTVVLHRSNELANSLRNYRIYINKRKVGVLANGETDRFSVAAGVHYLVAKIDHCRSKTIRFHVAPDEEVHFYVSGFKHANALLLISLSTTILWFILHNRYHINSLLYIPAAAFLFLCYQFTVRRNRYLQVKQVVIEATDAALMTSPSAKGGEQ